MLEAGDVGHELDFPQFGGVRHCLGDLGIIAEVGLDENHLAAHVAGDFLGFLALIFVDIETYRHEVVCGRSDGRGPADPRSRARDDAHVADAEALVLKNEYLIALDFRLLDLHRVLSSLPRGGECQK